MKQKIRLTKSEREIMDVLWKQGEALTSSEIIEVSTNRSWGIFFKKISKKCL